MAAPTTKIVNVASTAIASEATIYTPTTGKTFTLLKACLQCSTTQATLVLKDNTAGTTLVTVAMETAAKTFTFDFGPCGLPSATVNNVLTATGAQAGNLSGYLVVIEA